MRERRAAVHGTSVLECGKKKSQSHPAANEGGFFFVSASVPFFSVERRGNCNSLCRGSNVGACYVNPPRNWARPSFFPWALIFRFPSPFSMLSPMGNDPRPFQSVGPRLGYCFAKTSRSTRPRAHPNAQRGAKGGINSPEGEAVCWFSDRARSFHIIFLRRRNCGFPWKLRWPGSTEATARQGNAQSLHSFSGFGPWEGRICRAKQRYAQPKQPSSQPRPGWAR